MSQQGFGGSWTEDKLNAVAAYLAAYMKIMRGNTRAKRFTVSYVDGFAGSGSRTLEAGPSTEQSLFGEDEADVARFLDGSARRALSIPQPFDRYVFIEIKSSYVKRLEQLKSDYPQRGIDIRQGDVNALLPAWCQSMGDLDRAVVFLDPYGLQLKWSTLEAVAATQKIDLWLLVPLGQAIMRLLTRRALPPEAWAARLTEAFGTDDWKNALYAQDERQTLFDHDEAMSLFRKADYTVVSRWIMNRLKTIFVDATDEPLILFNSTGVPLYLLCFAASNPTGAPTAMTIAKWIIDRKNSG